MSKLRFMCKHINQKSNEVVFRKCLGPSCSHCTEHLIISTKAWDYLKERDFKWPNPTPSLTCPGHYKTYLQNDELDAQHYQTGFLKDFPIKILKDFGVKVLILLSDIFEWIWYLFREIGDSTNLILRPIIQNYFTFSPSSYSEKMHWRWGWDCINCNWLRIKGYSSF